MASFAACTMVAGCSDDEPQGQQSATTTAVEDEAFNRNKDWLEKHDEITPEQWLIKRAEKAGKALTEKEIETLGASLQKASHRFGESPRMIANRSAQLEAMLKDVGQNENAVTLISNLTDAVGGAGQTEGFGAICQHYFNIRKEGLSPEDAIADLRKRYGRRSE
jgi:hypothetical protein